MKICNIDGCLGAARTRGMCAKHYMRWRTHGDPSVVKVGHRFQEVDAGPRIAAHVVREGDCLVFTGGVLQRSGHRTISYKGRAAWVHRVAWELAKGAIPRGLCVCHSCDNPPCVNVDHLFLGTQLDNIRDRDAKGRQRTVHGSAHKLAKLSEEQVLEIKRRLAQGASQKPLGREFGVSQALISAIKRGRTWTHVVYEPDRAVAHHESALAGAEWPPIMPLAS